MAHRWSLGLVLVLLLAAPSLAGKPDAKKEEPAVPVASDKEAKHELKVFQQAYATEDVDYKLDAVARLGKCVHKDVMKRLLTVLFKDPDPYVKAEAAKGLARQVPFAKEIGKRTLRLLTDDKTPPKVLAQLVYTLGALRYTKAWEPITELIAHDDDGVVIAAFRVVGDWKELRAWREIQNFWDMYPEEGKFQTGTVKVDTGAAGTKDQKAAKRKWMAKYGNKRKQRVRPECVKALKEAVKKITGEDLKKPEEFREWCRAHKAEIKKAERRR